MQKYTLDLELLCSGLILFLIVDNVEAENTTSLIQGSYYSLNVDSFIGYYKKSIILELHQVSRIECSLKCEKVRGCKHVAFSEENRNCSLLRDVMKKDDLDDLIEEFVIDGKIYSFEDFSGERYLLLFLINIPNQFSVGVHSISFILISCVEITLLQNHKNSSFSPSFSPPTKVSSLS